MERQKDEMGRTALVRHYQGLGAEIVTFQEFMASKFIGLDSRVAPLLREAWNAAVNSTYEFDCPREGTRPREEHDLLVEESVTKP